MGVRRQGGQTRPYKDTLENSLKRLEIDPKDLGNPLTEPTGPEETGAAIWEASRMAAARATSTSNNPQHARALNEHSRVWISLVGHLQHQSDNPNRLGLCVVERWGAGVR
ncbi:hypothetical protein SprV_0702382500 [Sparganum proliferum]